MRTLYAGIAGIGYSWKPAKGGITYDILIEIQVPETTTLIGFSKEEIAWLIVSLIKISDYPYVSTPILSDISFNRVVEDDIEPTLIPNEVKRRIFRPSKDVVSYLSEETLLWIKGTWKDVATLMTKKPQFNTAMREFGKPGTVVRKPSKFFRNEKNPSSRPRGALLRILL